MSTDRRSIEQARGLRDRLRDEGRHQDAEIVQRVVRSLDASRSTNSMLWRDNMELRDRLRQAESEAVHG